MSPVHSAMSRLLTVSVLATSGLTTVAHAQPYGPGQGGGMMGGGWGWGMGGFGGIGLLVLALVVLAIVVLAFRRRTP